MDSRIEPLGMLGLSPGDAKILRNAGARVTPDVIRTLVLGVHLLGVRRVLVVPHTALRHPRHRGGHQGGRRHEQQSRRRRPQLRTTTDPMATLRADLEILRSSP